MMRCRPFFLALTAIALVAGVQSRGWRKRMVLLLLLTCAVAFSDVVLREYNDGVQIPTRISRALFVRNPAALLALRTWADRSKLHVTSTGDRAHASNGTAWRNTSVTC